MMKICILLSSYDGTGSPFECYDSYQNPGIYSKSHDFQQRFITKKNAKEEIDQVLHEGFDYIWNFLWGPLAEDIAGVNEVKYLESKNVPMIGMSSKFLALSKLDYKQAILAANIKTPRGIAIRGDDESIVGLNLADLKFPLILKPSVGCGSEHMTEDSVCQDVTALEKQIKLLKSKIHVNYEILIEEFIDGDEVSTMVLETKNGVIALQPLMYVFPNEWPATKKFLDFNAKFERIEGGGVKYKIFDGNEEVKAKIQETAIEAYLALGVLGSGYARVDFRVKGSDLYVLEINPAPAFFSALGNTLGDDFVIESTFPGGHENLIETIISSRIRFDTVANGYNSTAGKYETVLVNEGKWLDVAGTGMIGRLIKDKYDAHVTGIDVSTEMVKLNESYDEIRIGLVENVVLELKSTFEHVVCSGALEFLDDKSFEKLFARSFSLATKSITLVIADITEEYKLKCVGDNASMFNHVNSITKFPLEWTVAYKQRAHLWESPRHEMSIYGLVVRFDKK